MSSKPSGCRKRILRPLLLFITLFLGSAASGLADPLDNWHWRNPLPQGNSLNGVGYGNSKFVAVGNAGTMLTSTDGMNWALMVSGTTNDLWGISCGNGTFVAVGEAGTILTSEDGGVWVIRASGITNHLSGITYGNGTFVAVGEAGTILTSSDGVTWSLRPSGTTNVLSGITYGNGRFVAVGLGIILASSDGVEWRISTSYLRTFSWLRGVTCGNGVFVAVEEALELGAILTSSDGLNWTYTFSTYGPLNGITYGNGTFVGLRTPLPAGGELLTSADGVSWAFRTTGNSVGLNAITYGNGTFVAVGDGGTILQSDPLACPIPGTPSDPLPSNGAEGVPKNPILTWTPTSNADSYDIYFGTANPPTTKVATTTTATYSPSSELSSDTTYYWQIVARNNCGNSTSGPVWNFAITSLEITPQEGTVGTVIQIKGSDLGDSRGKVLIGSVPLTILRWESSEIEATLSRALLPGTYSLTVQPKMKGISSINAENAFTVRTPEIDSVTPIFALPGETMTIKGKFFGKRRGRVMIGRRPCRVTSWTMEPTTGESTIQCVVPRGLKNGFYDLKVINTISEDMVDFTILEIQR